MTPASPAQPPAARTVDTMAGYLVAATADASANPDGSLSVSVVLVVACPRCGSSQYCEPDTYGWPAPGDLDRWAAAFAVELSGSCENAEVDS